MPNTWTNSSGVATRLLHVVLAAVLAFTVVVVVPSFTEAASAAQPAVELEQCRNGAADSGATDCDWHHGNAGEQNSHFVEGYSIPYRLVMTDLPLNEEITLTLGYDIKHSSMHAIDFLTHYDRLQPHEYFGHPQETVTPTDGYGPFGTPTTAPIPSPDFGGNAGPAAEFAAVQGAGKDVMTLFGGTLGVIDYAVQGDLTAKQSQTSITLTFTATESTAILAWGGHIGTADAWGEGNSAGGVSGSPYHMRALDWSLNNLGNQDRSLSAAAVVPVPGLELIKSTANVNTDIAGDPGVVDAGDTISYGFSVTNTGNVTLHNVVIDEQVAGVDVLGGPIDLAPADTDSSTFTGTYVITQADVDAGSFENCAIARSEETDSPESCVTDYFDPVPGLDLEKTTASVNDGGDGVVDAGDTIDYDFRVENTGNITLHNVEINDLVPNVNVSGGPIASMAPGDVDTSTFSASYTLTQADIDAGSFQNCAIATSNEVDSNEDCTTDNFDPEPGLYLEKTTASVNDGGDGIVHAGDTIDYAFYVENTGNITLHDITIDDLVPGANVVGGPIASMAP
ncbi:MAG: hypothetical protein ABFR95_10670, partial [Actinomycetota bacterium]